MYLLYYGVVDVFLKGTGKKKFRFVFYLLFFLSAAERIE